MKKHAVTASLIGASLMAFDARAGDIDPYAQLRVDAIYDTVPLDDVQSPFVVFRAPDGFAAGPEFNLHPRLTRLGAHLAQGDAAEAAVWFDGQIEVDFQNGGRESRALLRMRHAYGTLHAGDFTLLFGQTWQTVSRLLPAANADTLMWGAGNTGDRSPQLRGAYHLALGDRGGVDIEAALQAQGTVHTYGQSGLNFGPLPAFEERVALDLSIWDDARPLLAAVGHHHAQLDLAEKTYGETEFSQQGIFVELQIPATRFVWLDGEYFRGANLADLRGGIGQGINPLDDVAIRTSGFWGQGNLSPIPALHLAGGYGQDAPNQDDIADGYPVLNRAIWGALKWHAGDDITAGLDVINWSTEYKAEAILNSVRFNTYLAWRI